MLRSDILEAFPRHGWIGGPTPVDALPDVASELGLDWVGVKRDDQCAGLYGGTKVRKLDLLLASPPWAGAGVWTSTGAIGSGHLAALAAAARLLGRTVIARTFWEPLSPGVLENLALTATGPTTIAYAPTMLRLALRRPRLLLGGEIAGVPVIPPGATHPLGVVALAAAGLELAQQVRDGVLPEPDRLYVPFGSGGTAAGLALGLALGGLSTRVHAIAVTSRLFTNRPRLNGLIRGGRDLLASRGLDHDVRPRFVVDGGQLGRGYGYPTPAASAAVERFDLPLEAVYSGKAMAALIAGATPGDKVLLWLTPRHPVPAPPDDWRDRLPPALTRRLADAEAGRTPRLTRRRVLIGAGAGVGVVALGCAGRLGCYRGLDDWNGTVLARWEALVVAAAAEAVVPDAPGAAWPDGPSATEIAANVDRYLTGMPATMLREVHALLAVVEHGTLLGLRLFRLTRLTAEQRRDFLERLTGMGGMPALLTRSLRDLVWLGFYQDPRTWPSIGYEGPLVRVQPPGPRGSRVPSRYDALLSDALPAGVVQ